MKELCCETVLVNVDRPKQVKLTVITEENTGVLGYVCIRPDFALRGDILSDENYIIKVIKDGFGTILDISRRK
jgi:hypothetical protein